MIDADPPLPDDNPVAVDELLREARAALATAPFAVERREAAMLLGRLLGVGEAGALARRGEVLPVRVARRYRRLVERRLCGEPVAYLFGEKEFYGRPFHVDDRVLIPRPETEHLVEAALSLPGAATARLLDLGTGSGCVAVTLAAELAGADVWAGDVSPGALAVAWTNARRHRVDRRLRLVAADLAAPLRLERFDVVLSNPPYLSPAAADDLSPEVRDHEPHLALFAPGDGRTVLERLLAAAVDLRRGARLLLEIGHDQADWLRHAVTATRHLELVELIHDYAGIPRTAVLQRRQAGSAR